MSRKALQLYKQLHRTSQKVFKGDDFALYTVGNQIRGEFDKNRKLDNEKSIEEMVKFGHEVKEVLEKRVLQLELKDENKYHANIRQEMEFGTNTIFRNDISEDEYKKANRRGKKKCSDPTKPN